MQRKPQGRGYSPNPAAAGRGNKSEQLGRRASPSQAMRPSEISPARQTVGFKTADERLLFAAQLLIGYTVQVQVNSGKVYEGIFHTADLDSKDASVVLKMARVIKDPAVSEDDGLAPAKPVSSQVIHAADLVQVIAVDVRMGAADVGPLGGDDAGGFGTDSAISRGRGGCDLGGNCATCSRHRANRSPSEAKYTALALAAFTAVAWGPWVTSVPARPSAYGCCTIPAYLSGNHDRTLLGLSD